MEQLYVLQCSGGKYYIGKTNDVMRRFEEHKSGKGSAWTNKYKPLKMLECRAITSDHDENNVTKDYMKKYGVENVRGGTYAQVTLADEVINVLQMEFRGNADICYKCNLAGHFATKCPNVEKKVVEKAVKNPVKKEPELKFNVVEEWGCSMCERTFTTKYGCSIHEKSCKKSVWCCSNCNTQFPDKKTAEKHEEKCGVTEIICFRCGNEGHKSTKCYAKRHVDGYEI